MKNALVITCGAAAGLIAGGLGSLLFGPAGTPPEAVSTPLSLEAREEPPRDSGAALAAKLDDLRSELYELQARITWLEDVAVDARQPIASPAEPTRAAVSEDLSRLASALESPGEPLPESLKLGVEQVIQDVRDAERREREARREEVLMEQTEERIGELVGELGLTPVQTDQMREYLSSYSQKRTELFETARESGDFYSVRDSIRELRRVSSERLTTILDPVQLERYEDLDDDSRRGWGRDRRSRDEEERR